MSTNTVKIQANVDRDLAHRVNQTIDSLGLTPTTLINMVYRTIDNTGELPVQTKLTAEQKSTLSLIRATKKLPTVKVDTPAEFDKVMHDDDESKNK